MKKKPANRREPKPLSLDGIMPLGGIDQPGREGRTALGDLESRDDGFHAQRATSQLNEASSMGSIAMAASGPKVVDEVIELDAPAKKIKHSRFLKKLVFWRRGEKIKKDRTRKQTIWLAARWALLVLILAGGGYFGFKFLQTSHNVFHGGGSSAGLAECQDMSQLKQEGDCRINILLLGIGGPGHDGSDLTDTMLIASIDPINNSIGLLSIPRDLWVKMPGDYVGSYAKINAAYEDGKYTYLNSENASNSNAAAVKAGFAGVDKTVSSVIGLKINYNVLVDFTAFKQAVNDVGGVDVDIKSSDPRGLYDPGLDYSQGANCCTLVNLTNGWHHLNGQQALDLARARGDSFGAYGFADSDFTRTQDQRTILIAIAQKVLSLGTFSNPVRVSDLMSSFGSNVFTDLNLSNVSPLYTLASRVPSGDITSLSLSNSPPNNLLTSGFVDGQDVQEPAAGIFDYSQIIPFVRATLRDGELAKENASVAIYNATNTPGLATDEAAILRSWGYRVTTVESAPNATDPAATTLVTLSDGKDPYTRHYLETRFNSVAATSLPASFGIQPPASTDFVIILGQDASVTAAASTTAG